MPSNKRVSNMLLSATLFVLLGVTAYFQLTWAIDLRQLEQQRLQSALAKNIVKLTAGIRQELYLLPTIAMTDNAQIIDIEKNTAGAIRFWENHSAVKTLFSEIYLFFPLRVAPFRVWNDGVFEFAHPEDFESLQLYTAMLKERRRDDTSSLLISLPDNKVLFMSPVTARGNPVSSFILCIVDYITLTEVLIPKLITSVFDDADSYNYRLYNTRMGKTLYLSDAAISAQAFALPDFTLPLLPFSNTGYTMSLQPIPLEKFPFTPEFYNFIKNKLDDLSGLLPSELPYENALAWKQDSLILELVHKDGSLFRASVKATVQNILTSLMVLVILGIGMLILVINTQKMHILAKRQQEFISTITHELKTPLAVISSAAQNLSDGIINNPEKIRLYGQIIQKEDVRLHSSIEYFLLYSHLNASAKLTRKKTDFIALVETVLTRNEQLLNENGFTVQKFLSTEPLFVYCDTTAITSVIQNLITNAVKHAESGKYLGVALAKESIHTRGFFTKNKLKHPKYTAVLRIIDHGMGIPKNEQKTIFEAFSRGRTAINMQIEGSGIGLNLAKRIVVMHDGTISIESSNQQGTVFAVTLPCIETKNGDTE